MAQPKLGTKVNQFLRLKKKISEKQKEVDDMKVQASQMQKELITALEDSGTERMDSALGSVTLKQDTVCHVTNWPKFYGYIKKNNAFELLQKRVGQSAYTEYLEAGERIPGTEKMNKKKLTIGYKRGV
jgi:hypothetical protein